MERSFSKHNPMVVVDIPGNNVGTFADFVQTLDADESSADIVKTMMSISQQVKFFTNLSESPQEAQGNELPNPPAHLAINASPAKELADFLTFISKLSSSHQAHLANTTLHLQEQINSPEVVNNNAPSAPLIICLNDDGKRVPSRRISLHYRTAVSCLDFTQDLQEATDAITLGHRHSWLESEVFYYPLPTRMFRNFRLPCTIEL